MRNCNDEMVGKVRRINQGRETTFYIEGDETDGGLLSNY